MLVLDELVLHVAQIYRRDVLALPEDADYNKEGRDMPLTDSSSFGNMEN